MRVFLFALLAVLSFAGCSSQQVLNAITPGIGYSVANDVAYDAGHDLKLDVYVPNGAENAPVVVFFYGGRWQQGDKKDYKFVGQALAAMGFVAVIPNYRLYPPARYKDFLGDCAEAVVWTHKFAHAYRGDADKLVLMGHSAGAYNAVMLTLDPEFLKAAGGDTGWIKGAIGLSGPYDILPLTSPDLRAIFGPSDQFVRSQAVSWANGGNPPLLLIASKADRIVNVRNTEELFDRVKRANGPVEKVIYQDLNHGDTVADLAAPLQSRADLRQNVAGFVHRVTTAAAPSTPDR